MKHDPIMQWQSPEKLQLDDSEQVVLEMARHFLLSWALPLSRAWEQALERSISAFGPVRGQTIAFALLDVLIQLRDARMNLFVFNDPRCETYLTSLTHCERHLLIALQESRNERQSAVRVQAMMLCEGNDMTTFVETLRDLSSLLDQ